MSSITEWRAFDILHENYPQVTEETMKILVASKELSVERVGIVNRMQLEQVNLILKSWEEQAAQHKL